MKNSSFRRIAALFFSLSLCGEASASGVAAAIARTGRPAGLSPVSGQVSKPVALSVLNFQMDQAAFKLAGALASVDASDVVEPVLESAPAAALVAQALIHPELRKVARDVLTARADREGAALADRLDFLGRSVREGSALGFFKKNGKEKPAVRDFAKRLNALFDGAIDDSVESFAAYAAGAFGAGVSAAPAVVARTGLGRLGVPSDSELHERVALSPLSNPERERVVRELFEKAGAQAGEIRIQDAGRGRSNIFVVKPGKTDRVIIVGGHHDKVHRGAGTIDNWTGATMVVNLYQALREVETEATYVFAAFSREEEGLLGARHFLNSMFREERKKIDAMINLDTLAVDGTFSWKNNSDRILLDMIKAAAGRGGFDLSEMRLWGGDSDSSVFRRAGIPAMTVLGASNDVIWDIIHSEKDTIGWFSLAHYKNAYLLVRSLLLDLDSAPIRRPGWFAAIGRASRRAAVWAGAGLRRLLS
jgi:hypothetical protein